MLSTIHVISPSMHQSLDGVEFTGEELSAEVSENLIGFGIQNAEQGSCALDITDYFLSGSIIRKEPPEMTKAEPSGSRISFRDTEVVKATLARGDRQHDIAAYFGVNGGRIAEIAVGEGDYPSAQPAKEDRLPPPGPYLTKYALQSVVDSLNEAIEAIELAEAEEQVEDVKAALVLARETLQPTFPRWHSYRSQS